MNVNTNANANYYRTDKIAVAPFLAMKKLKYCFGELDNGGKVYFVFNDPLNHGKDLSLDFERSTLSIYNNIWKTFRAELDKYGSEESYKAALNSKKGMPFYSTDRLALVPYLVMKELKFSHMGEEGKRKLFFFEDPLGIGQELSMDFERSEESVYNKYWHIFRREVDETKKNVRMGLGNSKDFTSSRSKVRNYE